MSAFKGEEMKRPKTDYKGFYENLVEQIQGYKGKKEEIIELTPEFFKLMTNLLEDHRTPQKAKPLINAAIAYFVAPYDITPEEVYGPIGFMDDIFICLYVIKRLREIIEIELLEDNWEGTESLLGIVNEVYRSVEKYIGDDQVKILDYVGIK